MTTLEKLEKYVPAFILNNDLFIALKTAICNSASTIYDKILSLKDVDWYGRGLLKNADENHIFYPLYYVEQIISITEDDIGGVTGDDTGTVTADDAGISEELSIRIDLANRYPINRARGTEARIAIEIEKLLDDGAGKLKDEDGDILKDEDVGDLKSENAFEGVNFYLPTECGIIIGDWVVGNEATIIGINKLIIVHGGNVADIAALIIREEVIPIDTEIIYN